jgi:hypothetical protein
MTYDVPRRRFVLLVALPFLVGACDVLLGIETPRATVDAAAIDASATVDASTDAIGATPDAASDGADAAVVIDAPVPVPDAAPPPDASTPDACVPGQYECSNGGVYDTCTGAVTICTHGCCNRGEGIVHCLNPGEVCNN